MRATASTASPVLVAIPIGTEVEIIEKTNDIWYKITYNDKIGYMMAKFLKSDSPEGTVSKDELQRIYDSLSSALKTIKEVLEK